MIKISNDFIWSQAIAGVICLVLGIVLAGHVLIGWGAGIIWFAGFIWLMNWATSESENYDK